MSETVSTTSTTTMQRAGIVAHALRALAEHVEAHHLDLGEIVAHEDHLEISINRYDARVWQASLRDGVDTVERRAATEEGRIDSVTLHGRLPDSGVRVELGWIERAPAGPRVLRAVTR